MTRLMPSPLRSRRRHPGGQRLRARGFIMGYILFALVVLGVVVAALSRLQDQQSDAKWVDGALSRLKDNLQNSRVQILTCAALITTGGTSAETQYPPQSDDGLLGSVTCPQGTLAPMQLFDGSSGVFTPTPPSGFSPYTYVNTFATAEEADPADVYIETTSASPMAFSALSRLQKSYSAEEMVVTTDSSGVTTMQYYIAKRAAGSP